MYCTEIKRAENHLITGKAQYKVTACETVAPVDIFEDNKQTSYEENGQVFFISGTKVSINLFGKPSLIFVYLKTNKPYRVGNLINPRKALGIPKKAH